MGTSRGKERGTSARRPARPYAAAAPVPALPAGRVRSRLPRLRGRTNRLPAAVAAHTAAAHASRSHRCCPAGVYRPVAHTTYPGHTLITSRRHDPNSASSIWLVIICTGAAACTGAVAAEPPAPDILLDPLRAPAPMAQPIVLRSYRIYQPKPETIMTRKFLRRRRIYSEIHTSAQIENPHQDC
jgi:hypothetical protein